MRSNSIHKKKTASRRADFWFSVALVVCVGLFFFSGSYIGLTFFEQAKINSETNKLAILAGVPESGANGYDIGDIVGSQDTTVDDMDTATGKKREVVRVSVDEVDARAVEYLDANLDKVMTQNSDTAGWFYLCGPTFISGIPVSAPLMHYDNNKYYLKHDFYKNSNVNGCIFLDARNSKDLRDNKNSVIYAHARSYSRFGGLKNLISEYWYADANNHFIKITTPTEDTVWQIFSYYYTTTTESYRKTDFSNGFEFVNYCNTLASRNIISSLKTFEFSSNDRILTLSTCRTANGFTRIAVHAVLVKSTSR